jgi:hypothetical protein
LSQYREPSLIDELTTHGFLRSGSESEGCLPRAAAFEFSGNDDLRLRAKEATTLVLHVLQELFLKETNVDVYDSDEQFRRAIAHHPSLTDQDWNLGLYLAQDFGIVFGTNSNSVYQILEFRINERIVTISDIDSFWERETSNYRLAEPAPAPSTPSVQQNEHSPSEEMEPFGECLAKLGEGGQSNVYLVRRPDRVTERQECIKKLNSSPWPNGSTDEARLKEFADAFVRFSRQDEPSELGALKIFKIPVGGDLAPLPGSKESEAINRLENEIAVLQQNRPGLPKLLYSDLAKRQIVTEYFPEKTLERQPLRYKGQAFRALKAFRSLVETAAALHEDGYVHRDIKPANVFIRHDDELVLGDFGIVYIPDQPDRLTMTQERVGPRDYMPPWADLGTRLAEVQPCFDVYMLGKLLWCMISGRQKLPREYHKRSGFDLAEIFPKDPAMHVINRILHHCVVEDTAQCLKGGGELLLMVDSLLGVMERGGQLLSDGVPRPCRVCGQGVYIPQPDQLIGVSLKDPQTRPLGALYAEFFICDSCGHAELFKTKRRMR